MLQELATLQTNPEEAGVRQSRLSAFVIDDDALMVELIVRSLVKHEVCAYCFDEPERLLGELMIVNPALLLTDLEMPQGDGIALVREARRRGYRGTIAVVTASRERERIMAAIEAGADDVVAKPLKDIDVGLLVGKARARLAGTSAARDALAEILEAIDQGVILLDRRGSPMYANGKALDLLAAENAADVARVVERSHPVGDHLDDSRGADGAVTFIDVSKPGGERRSPVGFETLALRHCIGDACSIVLLHDFSEWRKLDELHARFATYLSHRMRTPLTSVRNAVKILSERGEPLDSAEREKFLDIGFRNIEKLVRSFDELQKIFMIESGEINGCRSLVRVGDVLASHLGVLERGGKLAEFTVSDPGIVIPTSRAGLTDFVSRAVDALASWLGTVPSVDCVVSSGDACEEPGDEGTTVTVTLKPRGRPMDSNGTFEEFLSRGGNADGIVLERLASGLSGECEIAACNAVRLRLPADPPYCKDRDLVHPLHMMLERSELERSEFHMVAVKMVGVVRGEPEFRRLFTDNLCAHFDADGCVVSKAEAPLSYSLFVSMMPHDRLTETLTRLRERFATQCRERGEEIYPSIRWEIAYRHSPGETPQPNVLTQLEGIL